MFKSLRWRFSLTYFTITALLLLFLGLYLVHSMTNHSYEETEERLVSSARLVGDSAVLLIEGETNSSVFAEFAREKRDITGARVTIVDKQGKVLADSEERAQDMPNHAERPEFNKALQGGVGNSIRYSTTLKEKALYIAMPVKSKGDIVGAVRLSILWDEIQEGVWNIRWIVGTAIFLVFLLTVLISSSLTRDITAPLKEMTEVAKDMADGKLDRFVKNISDDEIGTLGRGLNYMARRLKDTITEITEEKNKIQAILASMAEGVVAVDKNRNILLINTAGEKIFNVKAAEVVGYNIIEGIKNYELEKIIGKALERGRNINQELEIIPLRRSFRVNVVPIMKAEGTLGVVAVLRDITELRELEHMRSEFVANVSHELRTPLTSIKGFVETLLDGAIDEREVATRFLEIINLETDRLTRLINDILSLSSLEAKEKDIMKVTVDISGIIQKVVSMLSPLAKEKNIFINSNITLDNPLIMANEDMIRQVLINLIDNAIKYTPEGGHVQITATPSRLGIKVSIQDTGIGMPVESMSRLFERFYRVDKARSRELGGTGLGLAIVKHVLDAHGGTIKVESQTGKGSKFTFYLPSA